MFSLVRKVALVLLIIFAVAFIGIMMYGTLAQYGPLWATTGMFAFIFASVLAWEILGSLTGIKKTVSTRYKYWLKKHPKLAWTALSFFILSMLALAVHLGFVKPEEDPNEKNDEGDGRFVSE